VEYRDGKPYRIHSITLIVSQQRAALRALGTLHEDLRTHVIEPAFVGEELQPDTHTHIFINPEGP
jgi:S-adenosylmethionine synthetase